MVSATDRFKDEMQLSLDTLNRKVTVHLRNKTDVYFSNIGQMLGFSPNTVISITSTAERAVDLEHGFHDFYVYCDIIQSQHVGYALVPLLRIVPVEEKDGYRESASHLFARNTYLSAESSLKVSKSV